MVWRLAAEKRTRLSYVAGTVARTVESLITLSTLPECLYSDNSVLLGGDLSLLDSSVGEWSPVATTNECISLCQNTQGCHYWTVSKEDEDSRCQLKSWKGRLIKKDGFISGSLPSACRKCDDCSLIVPAPLIKVAHIMRPVNSNRVCTVRGHRWMHVVKWSFVLGIEHISIPHPSATTHEMPEERRKCHPSVVFLSFFCLY